MAIGGWLHHVHRKRQSSRGGHGNYCIGWGKRQILPDLHDGVRNFSLSAGQNIRRSPCGGPIRILGLRLQKQKQICCHRPGNHVLPTRRADRILPGRTVKPAAKMQSLPPGIGKCPGGGSFLLHNKIIGHCKEPLAITYVRKSHVPSTFCTNNNAYLPVCTQPFFKIAANSSTVVMTGSLSPPPRST